MGEIRYVIIAKQCEVDEKSSILDGCLKKSFGHPSRINDFPCNLTQFCYTDVGLYKEGYHEEIRFTLYF